MSQRLKLLPANQLTTRVSDLQEQIEQQKAMQIAGSHNVVLTSVSTGNTVDFTATVAPNTVQQWRATFTPEGTAFANLGFVWHLFWHGHGTQTNSEFLAECEPTDPRINYLTAIGLNGAGTDTITFRVEMYTVGPGTISIVKTI